MSEKARSRVCFEEDHGPTMRSLLARAADIDIHHTTTVIDVGCAFASKRLPSDCPGLLGGCRYLCGHAWRFRSEHRV